MPLTLSLDLRVFRLWLRGSVECGYANLAPTPQKTLLAFALWFCLVVLVCLSLRLCLRGFAALPVACSFACISTRESRGAWSLRPWPLCHHYHYCFLGLRARDGYPALLPAVCSGVQGRLCPLTPLQETVKDSSGGG